MAVPTIVSLEETLGSLQRRPALLIGPDATRAKGELAAALVVAMKIGGIQMEPAGILDADYRSRIDAIGSAYGQKAATVEEEFRSGIRTMKPSLDISHLAKAGWSACISLSEDVLFETALRNYLDSIAGTRTLTVIDQIGMEPPPRTIPVYKLLGNVLSNEDDNRLVLSEAELLLRQQQWAAMLRSFPDFVMEAPLFVIGVTGCISLTRQVLGTLAAMPKPRPTKLYWLSGEGALSDSTIEALCKNFDTRIVDGSLRDLCAQLAVLKPLLVKPSKAAASAKLSGIQSLSQKHSGIVSFVPSELTTTAAAAIDMPSLLDGLFRPAAVNWLPFQHKLDVRRSSTTKLLDAFTSLLDQANPADARYFILRGEAGVGKTTLLKRLAIELAQQGVLTIWCMRTASGSWLRAFKTLASDLADWIKEQKVAQRIAIICDDPWGLRIDPSDLVSCFDRSPAQLLFVFSARNSEFASLGNSGSIGAVIANDEYEVPYLLDDHELSQLGTMLVNIGAAKDDEAAKRELARIPSRNAHDILCSLWYLVPETRSQLAESLRDEYCRLGAVKDVVGALAETASSCSGAIAHSAYEFVTVTSGLNVGLPMEVLVHALEVNYGEWVETVGRGRPLWGLLYDVDDERGETVLYFTRNEIVTRVLLELVNGGVGHSGEFRVLRKLIAACSPGSLVYRNFALEILVAGRKRLAEVLSFEQGMELYEIARQVLPHEDRLLEHHMGIWMEDVGHQDEEAYRQFERALLTEVYPGAERDAPKEHIHTSMAAALIKLIRAGKQDSDKGAAQVREHLRQASNPRFFNSHTSHVSASLLFDLAKMHPSGKRSKEAFLSVVEALEEIEKTRQIVGGRNRYFLKERKNLEMMLDLEKRILAWIPEDGDLRAIAETMFRDKGNQVGMEICARRLLAEATQTSKGRDFNKVNDYLNDCITLIENQELLPTNDLLIVRIDLYIRWLIQKFAAVPWKEFREDLEDVVQDPRYRDDVIKNFYLAVAHFHMGDITEANALFAALRRWQPTAFGAREVRCFYLNDNGDARRFQGTFRKEYDNWYFEVPELNVSVLSRGAPSQGAGAIAHAYLGFSLNGPSAIQNRPEKEDYLLT
jgi:hypothetical protein